MRTREATLHLLLMSLLLLGAEVLSACGGSSLSNTIDEDKLKEMSRDGQVWIFDAENEIVVALDRLDESEDFKVKNKRELSDAEQALKSAEKRNSRLGVEMAEAWIQYLEAMDDWADARIDGNKVGVVVALALVELAKAQVINREDLLGGKGFSIKDYQDQYNQLKNDSEKERKVARDKRKIARKLEEKWWKLRERFVAQTGDYDSGLWIE
jgi:hypothetical protein